jgi:hypothetical protein
LGSINGLLSLNELIFFTKKSLYSGKLIEQLGMVFFGTSWFSPFTVGNYIPFAPASLIPSSFLPG